MSRRDENAEFSRTAGVSRPGAVYKGSHSSALRLERKKRLESHGFSSTSSRFQHHAVGDNPGPGSYQSAPSIGPDVRKESASKKGFGTMLSRDRRFKPSRALAAGPGPGSYVVPNKLLLSHASIPGNHTSSFLTKVDNSSHLSHTPGPGAYTAAETKYGSKLDWLDSHSGHRSAFKAAGRPAAQQGLKLATPSPTQYNTALDWHVPEAANTNFKKSPGRMLGRTPGAHDAIPSVIYNDTAPNTSTPGPGAYETAKITSMETELKRMKSMPSPMFQRLTVEALGRRASPSTPGPGTYESDMAARRGVTSPFTSRSPQQTPTSPGTHAAGPAVYQPFSPNKKSFHLNARGRFVPP